MDDVSMWRGIGTSCTGSNCNGSNPIGLSRSVLIAATCAGLLLGIHVSALAAKSEKQLTKDADVFIANKPNELKPFFHTLYMEGEWNAVLNFDLLALAALEVGRSDIAELALDQAAVRILRIYANDPNAQKAKSLWSAESVKDFKGEPYERAMTFYYRGLIYLQSGDLQNARAAFLQSDLQNSMGQKENFDNKFSLSLYLAAWASDCDDDPTRAEDLLSLAKTSSVDPFITGATNEFPKHITLIERGIGPEKVTLGDAKSILGFLPQPDVSSQVNLEYPSNSLSSNSRPSVAGNIDWLALTRGGRPIQGILNGKVAFKEATDTVSKIALGVSAISFYGALTQLGDSKASVARTLGIVGASSAALGSIAALLSHSTKTEADTRYWGSLPKFIEIDASTAPLEKNIAYFKTSGSQEPRKMLLAGIYKNNCSFAFGREFSALDATNGGTGNPSPWPAAPFERGRTAANDAFRSMLTSSFQ